MIQLHLAGSISTIALENKIKHNANTTYYGILPWEEIGALIRDCDLGIVLLQPVSAYLYCTSENIIKLYEYMALGLPVLISDFPKLKAFIESNDCGIAVDPSSPEAIAKAIKYSKKTCKNPVSGKSILV